MRRHRVLATAETLLVYITTTTVLQAKMEGQFEWEQIRHQSGFKILTHIINLGCPDITIITNHKPLVELSGENSLADIPNPQIIRLS